MEKLHIKNFESHVSKDTEFFFKLFIYGFFSLGALFKGTFV